MLSHSPHFPASRSRKVDLASSFFVHFDWWKVCQWVTLTPAVDAELQGRKRVRGARRGRGEEEEEESTKWVTWLHTARLTRNSRCERTRPVLPPLPAGAARCRASTAASFFPYSTSEWTVAASSPPPPPPHQSSLSSTED